VNSEIPFFEALALRVELLLADAGVRRVTRIRVGNAIRWLERRLS
jgi:hypothetical protein